MNRLEPKTVLFVCVHNSGRSLAAKVLLEYHAQERVRVLSAGSEPAEELDPMVTKVLQERGLDISREFPKPLQQGMVEQADVVITMGCGEQCPVYPGKRYLDWQIPDPKGGSLEQVRSIVSLIEEKVLMLLEELGATYQSYS
jgi:arsenate reductase